MGLQGLYARLPVWGQHAAVTAFGAYWYWSRFGGTYAADVITFEARDRWTPQEWHDWQLAAVRALVVDAAAHVPYYRESWDRPTFVPRRTATSPRCPSCSKSRCAVTRGRSCVTTAG